MNGTGGAPKFPSWDYVGRESTMSFGACKQGLLNPTQWFAITYAIATAVNVREELTTLLVMRATAISTLNFTLRFFPTHSTWF
jgi:hypothetical protein